MPVLFERRSPDDDPDAASLGSTAVVLGPPDQPPPGPAVHRGVFEELSSFSRRDGADPDPLAAAGIMLVLLNNLAPEREAEFEAWYEGVHMPDVTAAAGFWGARRYRNVATDPGPGSAGYMAIYVTENPDVMAEYAGVRAAAPGWVRWPHSGRVHVACYERR